MLTTTIRTADGARSVDVDGHATLHQAAAAARAAGIVRKHTKTLVVIWRVNGHATGSCHFALTALV